jgi:hypothetical protein
MLPARNPATADLRTAPSSQHVAALQLCNASASDSDLSPFEQLIATTSLPPPGPSYYAARRNLWLTPRSSQTRFQETSTSRQRLETLLNRPGAVADEGVWKGGVERVWKGLAAGGRLKRRLPFNIVVCKLLTDCPFVCIHQCSCTQD